MLIGYLSATIMIGHFASINAVDHTMTGINIKCIKTFLKSGTIFKLLCVVMKLPVEYKLFLQIKKTH